VLQASEGGRVYLGRSALEIKLREMPGPFDSSEPTPVTIGSAPTERLALPAPTEPPLARLQTLSIDRPEREVVLARSTLIGICLTAFACGIVTTVALDRHHVSAMEREMLRAHDEQAAVESPAPAPAPAAEMAPPQAVAPAPVAAAPAPVAEPVVVQLGTPASVDTPPAKPVAEPAKPVADAPKPATARAAAARTPRPPAPARPAAHHKTAAEATPGTAPPASPAAGEWKDPFAE